MAWKAVKTTYSSKTGEKYYIKQDTVTKNYSCTCKSWVFSNESPKICKHIAAVLVAKTKKDEVETYWVVRRPDGNIMFNQLFSYEPNTYYGVSYLKNGYKVEQVRLKRVK